jgi:hypothetical protein
MIDGDMTHRYHLTPRGRLLTAAVFAARTETLKQLVEKAAIRAPRRIREGGNSRAATNYGRGR